MDKLDRKMANLPDDDPTAANRKRDHIELAFKSKLEPGEIDRRFIYEPLLAAHPESGSLPPTNFLGKTLRAPIWVSSMTGGTEWAHTINHNLARACHDFGMGMGLGSCRSLLFGNETLADFDVRSLIGDELPLFANLGVAQVEQLIASKETFRIKDLVEKLRADGLIIHVNPLQEWLQPEGDRFKKSPLETITTLLQTSSIPLIVKEVGQGMGFESLKALFQLPLRAIEFAAAGGTNFARLELMRSDEEKQGVFNSLAAQGHTAQEMVEYTNLITEESGIEMQCKQVIVSGGVEGFLDGYYLISKLKVPGIYGQASGFLKHARGEYKLLHDYISAQIQGLELAYSFLKIKP